MKVITYLIELHEPLLATAPGGDPNSSASLPYIPGSLVRGLLVARYLEQHKNVADPVRDTTCRRLFFDGSTRYLHAYPAVQNTRYVPTPRSLRHFKGEPETEPEKQATIFDTAHKDWTPDEQRKRSQTDSLKPVKSPFCSIAMDDGEPTGKIDFCQPVSTLTIHTQRDPRRGRAHKGSGEIFRYEALAAGQCFQGVILVDDEQDVATIHDLLKQLNHCWLGRSRSAGYGRVTVHTLQQHDAWQEIAGSETDDLEANTHATMTLLSDTLLFTSSGQPVTALDNDMLAAMLGIPAEQIKRIDTAHTFTSSVHRGGFNRAWQLPLPQNSMLAAGSVIAFELKGSLDAQRVRQLEAQGVGARRAEGFGRVVFNWQNTMELTSGGQKHPIQAQPPAEALLSDREQQMALHMAERLRDKRIEEAILAYIQTIRFCSLSSVQLTQLNRMRTLVRQHRARGSAGIQEVQTQFSQFKRTAVQQFERVRLERGGTPEQLSDWIDDLLKDPGEEIQKLLQIKMVAVAGKEPTLDDEHRAQIALRLLSAVLEQAVREKQDMGEEQSA